MAEDREIREHLLDESTSEFHDERHVVANESISVLDYATFAAIGASYLWPWNCFLSAAPYFSQRFEGHKVLQDNFSSSVMSITTVTGTLFTLVLADRQNADYSGRVKLGEFIIASVFLLLALSCAVDISAVPYFWFIQLSVFASSLGAGLAQNGSYAIGNTLTPTHTRAITVGQAVSGVLPPVISMLSATASGSSGGSSALATALYFLTSTGVCIAVIILFRSSAQHHSGQFHGSTRKRHDVPLLTLLQLLWVPAASVFVTFAVTLIYPVFASTVTSGSNIRQELFVPLVYLFWNGGDLVGRVACASRRFVIERPNALVAYSLARFLFVPVFFLCNVEGHGAVKNDLFYLTLQFAFGVTNGQLITSSLMGAPSYVAEEQREAAGGFMTLSLSMGLATGSLLSFGLVWILV
jgi:equilibrative nucleoside transporter 1/2/3